MTSLDARELCSAGFPDYPAGTLRMIAPQLARFLLMVMKGGAYLSVRLLAPALVRQMLSPQYPSLDPTIGMLWFSIRQGGDIIVVTVQTTPLLICEGDIGFHGILGELSLPHARRKIDHFFRGMDAHTLQHVDQVGVDIDAV
jgi:CubicO group peptidase (beta-lactamase class C family)